MKKRDLYQDVTDRIIAELEAGRLPWVRPWTTSGATALPCNAQTGNDYSGVNVILLWLTGGVMGYETQRWVTFKQALALGGAVRKGEKGTTVVYADRFIPKKERERAKQAGEAAQAVPFLKRYTVFNVAQCDGLPEHLYQGEPAPAEHARDDAAEALIAATGARIKHGGNGAFYTPASDMICLPHMGAFHGSADYYATALHELVHWTGASHRLDRNLKNGFGSKDYAREELVAEMGAAFLCAPLGFEPQARHSDYIASWLQVLKDDKRAIFKAASAATKAAEFVKGFAAQEQAAAA